MILRYLHAAIAAHVNSNELFECLTVLTGWESRWPKCRIAYRRLNTTTTSCRIVRMETRFECTECFATNNLDTLYDQAVQVWTPTYYTHTYGKAYIINGKNSMQMFSLLRINYVRTQWCHLTHIDITKMA